MFRKIGDGLLTCFVILVVIGAVLSSFGSPQEPQFDDQLPSFPERGFEGPPPPNDSPAREQEAEDDGGRVLPAPSRFDDRSRVEAADVKNWTSGTGFAIASGGLWLTAKHVARGCDRLGIVNNRGRIAIKARPIYLADNADVAIFQTEVGPAPMAMDLDESDIKVGSTAFHVGYPQGKPGEVTSRLIGRELMTTEGAWRGREQTLSWAETSRTNNLVGTLGGLSGGPAFDTKGNIIGITVAENPRRGRLVTTSAASISAALQEAGIAPDGAPQGDLRRGGFDNRSDQLRADMKVVLVVCMVDR